MGKLDLFNLKRQMNPSQLRLFQRLVEILPDMKEKNIIESLVAMHILGINEKERISRILKNLKISKGVTIEDKRNWD